MSARYLAAAPQLHVPALVATARELLGQARGRRELLVDLSDVPPRACCAELAFLVHLLRRALGPGVHISLVGVTPALAAPLIGGGLGDGVDVVDTRGRRWPGRPDQVKVVGTWP